MARPAKGDQMNELHGVERQLNPRSVDELIRVLRSEHFDALTSSHIRTVGEYGAIDLAGERFFARAFSTGKEVAFSLALARELGASPVLRDLLTLRASMGHARS